MGEKGLASILAGFMFVLICGSFGYTWSETGKVLTVAQEERDRWRQDHEGRLKEKFQEIKEKLQEVQNTQEHLAQQLQGLINRKDEQSDMLRELLELQRKREERSR